MLLTAHGLADHVSGVILYDETIRQSTADGRPFVEYLDEVGILPGIKVDTGAKALALHAGEKVTEGLDGLRDRLGEYRELGARFAKWRAVITIGDGLPSAACIEANTHALARYAALCQEAGIVPVVEPEVLMDGDHGLDECFAVTADTLHALFGQLIQVWSIHLASVTPDIRPSKVISQDKNDIRLFLRLAHEPDHLKEKQ